MFVKSKGAILEGRQRFRCKGDSEVVGKRESSTKGVKESKGISCSKDGLVDNSSDESSFVFSRGGTGEEHIVEALLQGRRSEM
jgi:hypothetical protein